MMQNVSATDPRGIYHEAEIRSTESRLDTTSDIVGFVRMRLLQDVLPGLTPAPMPATQAAPKPRRWRRSPPTCEP